MTPIGNVAAAVIALLGWCALGLQCYLTVSTRMAQGSSLIAGVVFFFSFFTVTTNTLVAVMLTAPLVRPRSRIAEWLSRPSVRGAAATYMAVVTLVYSLALREVWGPQGSWLLADRLLHDILPITYLFFWAGFVEKGQYRSRDVGGWLVYPLVFMAYSFIRGAFVDWYPYHFVDVTQLGYPRALLHTGLILCVLAAVGLLIVWIDRTVAGLTRRSVTSGP